MPQSYPAVAQILNLLYRRIPFGRPAERLETPALVKACGLKIRDSAGWQPALRAFSPGQTEALQDYSAGCFLSCREGLLAATLRRSVGA